MDPLLWFWQLIYTTFGGVYLFPLLWHRLKPGLAWSCTALCASLYFAIAMSYLPKRYPVDEALMRSLAVTLIPYLSGGIMYVVYRRHVWGKA